MMKRVVCDETFPLLHCNSFSTMMLHKLVETTTLTKHFALRQDSYEKMSTSKSKVLHDNTGTSSTPPLPFQHTHTHHSFYDERLLGCKFLQYLSEAQNHADKFLVAFLLI
jgi:hypothetical protein